MSFNDTPDVVFAKASNTTLVFVVLLSGQLSDEARNNEIQEFHALVFLSYALILDTHPSRYSSIKFTYSCFR
jgi:hypothetical protein